MCTPSAWMTTDSSSVVTLNSTSSWVLASTNTQQLRPNTMRPPSMPIWLEWHSPTLWRWRILSTLKPRRKSLNNDLSKGIPRTLTDPTSNNKALPTTSGKRLPKSINSPRTRKKKRTTLLRTPNPTTRREPWLTWALSLFSTRRTRWCSTCTTVRRCTYWSPLCMQTKSNPKT